MPYTSDKQRRFMHAVHPDIAAAWDKGRSSVTGKKETASQRGKRKSKRGKRK
jgi:hypothetical protein